MPQSIITAERTSSESATFALSPLAAAISFALTAALTPLSAQAQETKSADASEPRQLSKLVAKDADDIKVDNVASPKFTQPLLDTPQTITVVTQEVLRQQGAGTLMEALANTPGITMQLGENGNTGAGDTFSIRGNASQTNIFVDGIRDLGAVARDIFNVEQVEIAKGAVGADYGRGATAGYINLISKLPQIDDFGMASLIANTGVTVRATSDLNNEINDNAALRVNAMWQDGDVVGRDFVKNTRWGVAPSIAFGLNTATRIYLYSQHVRANNIPDGGIPAIGFPGFVNGNGAHPDHVDTDNYYGRYDDYEKTRAEMGTLRIEHDFSDAFRLTNATRYGESHMDRVLTGINALTTTNPDPSQWQVARTRQFNDQKNNVLTNQTNLRLNFKTGFIEHDVTSGVEFIKEEQASTGWAGLGTVPAYLNGGTAINLPNANLYNPDAYFTYLAPYAPYKNGADSNGETRTYAAYAFDTLKFGESWLLTAGARYEHFDTDFFGAAINNTTGVRTLTDLSKSDNLLSWKAGVVFKPVKYGSIYVSYSNSLTPPGNDNFALSATATNINNPNLDAQEATNTEIGTKWDLLDARLSLTAALYRTDNRNQLVIQDTTTNEFIQYGKRRVQGAELGAVGKITDHWSLIAGFAWSDNEQVSGAASGTNATGATARWAPDYSANLWTTYTANKLSAGMGINYVDEQKRVTDPNAPVDADQLGSIPGYTVFNGMLGYNVNDSLGLQVNVYNLFNKEYLSALNNGGSRVRVGVERYAQLAINFKF